MNSQIPPLPLGTLESYAQQIFAAINRGESISTVWVPMAGRRVRNLFIINNPKLFEKQMGTDTKYLLVYIEPLELTEDSHFGYFKLIARAVVEAFRAQNEKTELTYPDDYYSSAANYTDQIDRVKSLLKEIVGKGFELVLFIGEFDELSFANSILFNNLKSIWVGLQRKLHFVFLLQNDLTSSEKILQHGDFNEVLLENVVYIPLLKHGEIDYILDYFINKSTREFGTEEKELIKNLCGGHPFLIRACIRIIAQAGRQENIDLLRQLLFSHYEPRSVCQKIFDILADSEKRALKTLVNTNTASLPDTLKMAASLGLVVNETGYWSPFGELFKSVIVNSDIEFEPELTNGLRFEIRDGSLFFQGKSVEGKFTHQEYDILRFLLSDSDKIKSRDEIGEAMWGKTASENYSDWAIDQAMSKIRKKLKAIGAAEYLVTIRGRGYKLGIPG